MKSISYDLKHVSVYFNEREKIQVYFQNSSFRNYLVPMVSFFFLNTVISNYRIGKKHGTMMHKKHIILYNMYLLF